MRETQVDTRQFIINKVNGRVSFTHWIKPENAGRYVIGVRTIATLLKGILHLSLQEVLRSVLTETPKLQGIGGWSDEDGTYFLDCVVGENDLSTAKAIGEAYEQLCIWDTVEEKEIWI